MRGLSRSSLVLLEQVRGELEELRPFWPVTLRQVYYQLVAHLVIENTRGEYQKLSRLLTTARLAGEVPWLAIEDRARQHLRSEGWSDAPAFLRQERDRFLTGYRRDLLRRQPWALEVWIEKDALSRICHDVAFRYCVPVIVARGFCSISYARECHDRVIEALEAGRNGLRILYFGDLDPSGWEMLPALLSRLQEDMELGDSVVEGIRCALTPEQVSKYELPRSLDALKESDTRTPKYREWLEEEGYPPDLAVELDAVPPALLQGLVKAAIEENLDLEHLQESLAAEEEDLARINALRDRALAVLDLDDLGQGEETW